jgi:hypothetical protein
MSHCIVCQQPITERGFLPTAGDSISQVLRTVQLSLMGEKELKELNKSHRERVREGIRRDGKPPGPPTVVVKGMICERCMGKLEGLVRDSFDQAYHQRFLSDKAQAADNARGVLKR